jgi:HKD family nuclease
MHIPLNLQLKIGIDCQQNNYKMKLIARLVQAIPKAAPIKTSVKKCTPSKIREPAMAVAQTKLKGYKLG